MKSVGNHEKFCDNNNNYNGWVYWIKQNIENIITTSSFRQTNNDNIRKIKSLIIATNFYMIKTAQFLPLLAMSYSNAGRRSLYKVFPFKDLLINFSGCKQHE